MKILFATLAFILILSCNSSEKKNTLSKLENSDMSYTPNDEKTKIESPELQESMARGQEIYTDFCITCHLPNGKGVPRSFPPLANSDYLMNKREESIKAIKYGMSGKITVNGETYNTAMAPLGLSDEEVADVMNYITNSWGNKNKSLITEEEVSKIQP